MMDKEELDEKLREAWTLTEQLMKRHCHIAVDYSPAAQEWYVTVSCGNCAGRAKGKYYHKAFQEAAANLDR